MSQTPSPQHNLISDSPPKEAHPSPRRDPDPGNSGVLAALSGAYAVIDEDHELLESWRAGSSEALETLFKRHEKRVFGICLRMLNNPEVAADVAQDAFVRIYEGLSSFDGRARFSTWMVRVTLNSVYSYLRRERLRRHAPLPEPDEGRDPRSREPSPSSSIEREGLRSDVFIALGTIDLDARAILVLRDLQGLEYSDIAEVIGTPIGTVRSRLFRARAALRRSLEEMGHRGAPRLA
jgi:RNA polymerase sigma-70 factor (ECF subfamily)